VEVAGDLDSPFREFYAGMPVIEQSREFVQAGQDRYVSAQLKRRSEALVAVLGDAWTRLDMQQHVDEFYTRWASERWQAHARFVSEMEDVGKLTGEAYEVARMDAKMRFLQTLGEDVVAQLDFLAEVAPNDLHVKHDRALIRVARYGEVRVPID
jgi:hypothetical protein